MWSYRGPPLCSCSHRVHPYRIGRDGEWRRGWVGSQSAQSLCFSLTASTSILPFCFIWCFFFKDSTQLVLIFTPRSMWELWGRTRGGRVCETVSKLWGFPQANLGSAGPQSISRPGSHEADMPRRKQQAPRRAAGMHGLLLARHWLLSLFLFSFSIYAPFLPIFVFPNWYFCPSSR